MSGHVVGPTRLAGVHTASQPETGVSEMHSAFLVDVDHLFEVLFLPLPSSLFLYKQIGLDAHASSVVNVVERSPSPITTITFLNGRVFADLTRLFPQLQILNLDGTAPTGIKDDTIQELSIEPGKPILASHLYTVNMSGCLQFYGILRIRSNIRLLKT